MDIVAARKQLGLSQEELAFKLGIEQSTVSRFETGVLIPNERTLLAVKALILMQADPGSHRADRAA